MISALYQKVADKCALLLMFFPRKLHYRKLRKRLRNPAPTILSNNCFGGLMYHNLGLQFSSPTINLYFSDDGFLTFLQNLEACLAAELEEVKDAPESFPVGRLTCGEKTVRICFMHYRSFAEAKEKWDARKRRINLSNLYIVSQGIAFSPRKLRAFEELPYDNILLVAGSNPTNHPYVQTHPILREENYRAGEILEYTSRFSLHRHMDEIDYVEFLNRSYPE